ncbi:MAG: hypothetical protein NWF01_07180 [Candidatus Bathyarchaeota archaeon]|nr:hypothetical protein [Candidatus Bathyarchaeota archaeon]
MGSPISVSTSKATDGDYAITRGYVLLDSVPYDSYPTEIGQVFSTEGVTTDLRLGFTTGINVMTSFNGGPLGVYGSSGFSQASVVDMPDLSNGQSATVYKMFDYAYCLWYWVPLGAGDYAETWSAEYMYPSSAYYVYDSPSPMYKPPSQSSDQFVTLDTPSYQTKQITKVIEDFSGSGWSFDIGVTLSGQWTFFSGDVNIGGTFEYSGYSQSQVVYNYQVQGQRIILVDSWNYGPNQGGTVLCYKNEYWATTVTTSGRLTGSGDAYYATRIIGQNGQPYGTPYAQIVAPNYGDAGQITVQLNAPTQGRIFAYGDSQSGFNGGHLYCYVSNDGNNWHYAGTAVLNYQGQNTYIDCGYYGSQFQYVSLAGYNDNYQAISVYIDALHIMV